MACGLREGWRSAYDGKTHGMVTWVASKVKVVGGGNPTPEAVRQLFQKVDGDDVVTEKGIGEGAL